MSSLNRKTALITGSARGIGRVSARILSEEGANIALVDILPEVEETRVEIRNMGGQCVAAIFDIAEPDQIKSGLNEIGKSIGEVDILVNNAGIVNNIAPLTKMTFASWQREIAVNLTGAFNMIQAVIGPMIRKKWGRIINISSLGATGGLHRQIGYAASKAGLLGLTKTVTLEHARDGITCNAIVPGLIDTEMVRKMPDEIRKRSVATIPALRLGQMEEVGYLIAFLASDRAGFINGEEIHIDGGMRLNSVSLGSRKEAEERSGAQIQGTYRHDE
jgi:NAD(P)-dependent dehydrogenase (short-subunit alcohol dehydrogenase family)